MQLTSIRLRLGTRALTSLIILGFDVGSNDSSLTAKIVFSFGFSCRTSGQQRRGRQPLKQRTASIAGSASTGAAAAGAADGIAISWMFSRVCWRGHEGCQRGAQGLRNFARRALRAETRSAACRRVRPEISSTMRDICGSDEQTMRVEWRHRRRAAAAASGRDSVREAGRRDLRMKPEHAWSIARVAWVSIHTAARKGLYALRSTW